MHIETPREALERKIKIYNDYIDATTHKYQKIYGFKIGQGEHATWNNESDAFKHTFASADMAIRHGSPTSYLGGIYHEFRTINNPSEEKNMDYWNNSKGKAIASELEKRYGDRLKQMSKEQIANLIAPKVMEKMHKGELITSPLDQRKYKGFDEKIGDFFSNMRDKHNITGFVSDVDSSSSGENSPKYMDKNGDRVYTREDLHNMSKEEENTNHDAIMTQYHKMGIPTQAEIQRSLNKKRPKTVSELRDISNMGDHWVTINGNHVLL